jgi:hypothetical protein
MMAEADQSFPEIETAAVMPTQPARSNLAQLKTRRRVFSWLQPKL